MTIEELFERTNRQSFQAWERALEALRFRAFVYVKFMERRIVCAKHRRD